MGSNLLNTSYVEVAVEEVLRVRVDDVLELVLELDVPLAGAAGMASDAPVMNVSTALRSGGRLAIEPELDLPFVIVWNVVGVFDVVEGEAAVSVTVTRTTAVLHLTFVLVITTLPASAEVVEVASVVRSEPPRDSTDEDADPPKKELELGDTLFV